MARCGVLPHRAAARRHPADPAVTSSGAASCCCCTTTTTARRAWCSTGPWRPRSTRCCRPWQALRHPARPAVPGRPGGAGLRPRLVTVPGDARRAAGGHAASSAASAWSTSTPRRPSWSPRSRGCGSSPVTPGGPPASSRTRSRPAAGTSWTPRRATRSRPEPDRLWRAVLRRQRGNLALVATFPDDPDDELTGARAGTARRTGPSRSLESRA